MGWYFFLQRPLCATMKKIDEQEQRGKAMQFLMDLDGSHLLFVAICADVAYSCPSESLFDDYQKRKTRAGFLKRSHDGMLSEKQLC